MDRVGYSYGTIRTVLHERNVVVRPGGRGKRAATHGIALAVVELPGAKRGFVPLPCRWVVERDFTWISRFRRFAHDHERLVEALEGLYLIASVLLMLPRVLAAIAATPNP